MRKRVLIGTLAGASAIAVGGTTAALASGHSPDRLAVTAASSSASPAIDVDRAAQIARERVRGATVTETGLDHEQGQLVWEVELTKQQREYEVTIDAANGTVVKVEQDAEDAHPDGEDRGTDERATSGSTGVEPKVSADRARQIAQGRVPGGSVTETDLDREHGQLVWEVELTQQQREYEVTVDAVTGAVVKVDQDHHGTEHDDD